MTNRNKKSNAPRTGRFGRAAMLGGLGAGLAKDVASAAGRWAVTTSTRAAGERFHHQAAERLLASLGKMKGLPMKLGQMLSYIDDMIPEEYRHIYAETLRTLRVKAAPVSWEVMRSVLAEELGRPLSEDFEDFETKPIAAASIGQVYAATLPGGRRVAVKVQYPGVLDAIRADLKNADMVVSALSAVLPKVELERTFEDLTARLEEECDYVQEARHQQTFAELWADDPEVFVPAAHIELSTERVLITDLVEGRSWEEMLQSTSPEERLRYGRILFRFAFRSLYVFGIFNADPHPGNYVFMPDNRVAFLDFGCVQRYRREMLDGLRTVRDLVIGGADTPTLYPAMATAYGIPEDLDDELQEIAAEYVRFSFAPLTEPQPFRFTRAFTERTTQLTMQAKLTWARKIFKTGVIEAKQEGMIYLYRINFGLYSLLAALETEADWPRVIGAIDVEVLDSTGDSPTI